MRTASSDARDVSESCHLGVNSYIVKPVTFEQFAASVVQLGLFWILTDHAPDASD